MCFQHAGMAWAEQGGGEHAERPMNALYASFTPGFIHICTVTHITEISTQDHVISPTTLEKMISPKM